jgi:hypothetical protein
VILSNANLKRRCFKGVTGKRATLKLVRYLQEESRLIRLGCRRKPDNPIPAGCGALEAYLALGRQPESYFMTPKLCGLAFALVFLTLGNLIEKNNFPTLAVFSANNAPGCFPKRPSR